MCVCEMEVDKCLEHSHYKRKIVFYFVGMHLSIGIYSHWSIQIDRLRVVLIQSKELMVSVFIMQHECIILLLWWTEEKKKRNGRFRSRGFLPNVGQVRSAFSFPARDNGSFKSLTLKANETHSSSVVMSDVGGRGREGRGRRGIIIMGQQK